MTTTADASMAATMLPYRQQGDIDYAGLDVDPGERELPPDAMEQESAVQELLGLLASRFIDSGQRPDPFLSSNTILCYDPKDLNVRVAPDVYLAFGVDAPAIRPRKLYLPWEVGKPPDLAVEVASASTARPDVTAKRRIYACIGVPEYWRFDPTGGQYHGQALAGERLVEGLYLCWARKLETTATVWPGHGDLRRALARSGGCPAGSRGRARCSRVSCHCRAGRLASCRGEGTAA